MKKIIDLLILLSCYFFCLGLDFVSLRSFGEEKEYFRYYNFWTELYNNLGYEPKLFT